MISQHAREQLLEAQNNIKYFADLIRSENITITKKGYIYLDIFSEDNYPETIDDTKKYIDTEKQLFVELLNNNILTLKMSSRTRKIDIIFESIFFNIELILLIISEATDNTYLNPKYDDNLTHNTLIQLVTIMKKIDLIC